MLDVPDIPAVSRNGGAVRRRNQVGERALQVLDVVGAFVVGVFGIAQASARPGGPGTGVAVPPSGR